jgi:hypothetical protein
MVPLVERCTPSFFMVAPWVKVRVTQFKQHRPIVIPGGAQHREEPLKESQMDRFEGSILYLCQPSCISYDHSAEIYGHFSTEGHGFKVCGSLTQIYDNLK